MSTIDTVSYCTNCLKRPPEQWGYCTPCIVTLKEEGWRFNDRTGTRRKGGMKITPGGNATLNVNQMPPRMMALMSGELSPEDLDDEELARGMCRDENGQFPRRKPDMVPRQMHDRMLKELFSRADVELQVGLMEAVQGMVSISTNEDLDANVRLKAATWIFERLRGKTPEVLQVSQAKPFEVVLEKIHRGPRREQADPAHVPVEDNSDSVEEPPVDPSPTRIQKTRRHSSGSRPGD